MKFIAKSMLALLLVAIALGGITYNVMSTNLKQNGTITLATQNLSKENVAITNEVEKVEMDGPFDVNLVQADKSSLVLEGDARLLSKVVVQQDGNTLRIGTKGILVTMNQTLKMTLSIPKLTALTQFGSGDSTVQGFTGPQININLNGSGDLAFAGQYEHLMAQTKGSGNMELDVGKSDKVELNTSGSGDVVALGKAMDLVILTTGSGNIDAQRLIAQHSSGESHGSGDLKLYATQDVRVILTGSGDAEVFGNPAKRSVTNTGSGDMSWN